MILIGGPIFDRAWILPTWLEAIERQDWPLNEIGFVFEGGPNDAATHNILFDWHERHPEVPVFDLHVNTAEKHKKHGERGQRRWNLDRYVTMVRLRNSVLGRVRVHAPDRFFSLDTDIILEDPQTISKLYELTEQPEVDAAAPLMFMTPSGTRFPSVMTWTTQPAGHATRLRSYPIGTTFKTDVIMAAKMMTPRVYNGIDYTPHRQGEDLGWSGNAAKAGFNLYSMSGTYCPHLMNPEMLVEYLAAGDTRTSIVTNCA